MASKDMRGGNYAAELQPKEIYRDRRRRLLERAGEGMVVMWGAGDDRGYGDVGTFRQSSSFFYLTGVELPMRRSCCVLTRAAICSSCRHATPMSSAGPDPSGARAKIPPPSSASMRCCRPSPARSFWMPAGDRFRVSKDGFRAGSPNRVPCSGRSYRRLAAAPCCRRHTASL